MRLIWWAAILAGVSYMAAVLGQMYGPAIIVWKGLGVGLLALWAAMMANQRDGWLIALVLTLGALGDVLLDAKGLEVGALAFAAGHFVAAYLYARNARPQRSLSQNLLALALVPASLIICVAMLYPATGWWHAALYTAIVAAMAACAWISRFPRYRTGLGAIAFLISDLMDEGYEDALKISNRKHDLVVLRTTDPREQELPSMGLVQFTDPETGEQRWVDTGNKRIRDHYRAAALKLQARTRDALRRAGVDHAVISTREGYVKPLMNLFRQRD